MLFLQNCDLWSVFNKHQNFLRFKKKLENYASYKKSHESKHSFSTFYISLPKFKALGSIIKNSKTESVPLIDITNELIRKILCEQMHNQIIYVS